MTDTVKQLNWNLREALRYFGINNSRLGYGDTMTAMKFVWENEDRMRNLEQYVYPLVAEANDRSEAAVKSAIHRAAKAAWKRASSRLKRFDPSLVSAPTNSELLEIILQYLEENMEKSR